MRSDIRGIDCARFVFDTAQVGSDYRAVAADFSMGREFNYTGTEMNAVGLGAEED